MERSLYRFILRYSRSEQLAIVPLVVASMLLYFATLDLPKTIINEAIQGRRFSGPEATVPFLALSFELPAFLGGGTLRVFDGIPLAQVPYLVALTLAFLALIVVGGLLKYQINTLKGWMGERMLRRLRYALIDRILRFPLARFRRVKSAELASMIKDEVEPLGGFIGEALVTPLFLGGQALTALFFIMVQHLYLGSIALAVVLVQAFVIPRLRRRILALSKERQLAARALAGRIAEVADGAVEIHANDTSNYERAEISARLARIFRIRFEIYQRKFMVKFLNNFLSQLAPFFFYLVGGYLVIVGRLDIGTLVAVIAAYKDLPSPVKELIDWDQQRLDVQLKYTQVIEQFMGEDLMPKERQKPLAAPPLPESGTIRVANLTLAGEAGVKILENVSFEVGLERHVAIVGGQGSGASELRPRARAARAADRRLDRNRRRRHRERPRGGQPAARSATSARRPISFRRPCAKTSSTPSSTIRCARAVYEGEAAAERAFQLREAKRRRLDAARHQRRPGWTTPRPASPARRRSRRGWSRC
ncbi:MAG: ABC transporter ATP-binding protein [Burkholderiales bacterium]|nr:ABC transporter ATP-binding protein [Burkholderiales bacterium]